MDGLIHLNELRLDEIRPNETSINTTLGGCKLVIIGKPGSGKSTLIKALLASKRSMIPCAVIISGSEEANNFYKGIVPSLFIYQKFTPQIIARIKARQIKAKAQLGQRDSWLLLVIDDCMDNAKLFHDSSVIDLFKNGRHWNVLVVVANQYCMDMLPALRSSVDGVFIFRENNVNYKDKLYNNFASVVPSKKLFYNVMDQVTLDYTCMYIDNSRSHENWSDAVRWYKAPLINDDIIPFGCKSYWDYAVNLGENMPTHFKELEIIPDSPLSFNEGSFDILKSYLDSENLED